MFKEKLSWSLTNFSTSIQNKIHHHFWFSIATEFSDSSKYFLDWMTMNTFNRLLFSDWQNNIFYLCSKLTHTNVVKVCLPGWFVGATWLLTLERFHLVTTLWVTKIPSLSNNQLWTSLPAFKVTGSKWNVCEVKHACTFTYMIKIPEMETGELADGNFL